MRNIFFLLFITSFGATAQDTASYPFIKLPAGFVQKYGNGKLRVGVNQFHAVQTTAGEWVTSANAINEFPAHLREVSGAFTIVRLRPNDFIIAGTPTTTIKPPRPVQRPRRSKRQ